jgi:ABC-type proline/glycine betaine transport system permease subunit
MRSKRREVLANPLGCRSTYMEKEDQLVLNELWAKVSAHEKLVVYGAAAAVVGVVVGLILASVNPCAGAGAYGALCPSINYFTWDTAGIFVWLTLIAAVASLVVVYLHVAPNMKVTWPMPYPQILLGVAGATFIFAVLIVVGQLIRAGGFGTNPPIFMYIADVLCVGGGALAAYAAYMDYTAFKAA